MRQEEATAQGSCELCVTAFDLRCNFSVDFCNSVGMELVCKVLRLHIPFAQVLKQPKVQRYSSGLQYAHASVFDKNGV